MPGGLRRLVLVQPGPDSVQPGQSLADSGRASGEVGEKVRPGRAERLGRGSRTGRGQGLGGAGRGARVGCLPPSAGGDDQGLASGCLPPVRGLACRSGSGAVGAHPHRVASSGAHGMGRGRRRAAHHDPNSDRPRVQGRGVPWSCPCHMATSPGRVPCRRPAGAGWGGGVPPGGVGRRRARRWDSCPVGVPHEPDPCYSCRCKRGGEWYWYLPPFVEDLGVPFHAGILPRGGVLPEWALRVVWSDGQPGGGRADGPSYHPHLRRR